MGRFPRGARRSRPGTSRGYHFAVLSLPPDVFTAPLDVVILAAGQGKRILRAAQGPASARGQTAGRACDRHCAQTRAAIYLPRLRTRRRARPRGAACSRPDLCIAGSAPRDGRRGSRRVAEAAGRRRAPRGTGRCPPGARGWAHRGRRIGAARPIGASHREARRSGWAGSRRARRRRPRPGHRRGPRRHAGPTRA